MTYNSFCRARKICDIFDKWVELSQMIRSLSDKEYELLIKSLEYIKARGDKR